MDVERESNIPSLEQWQGALESDAQSTPNSPALDVPKEMTLPHSRLSTS